MLHITQFLVAYSFILNKNRMFCAKGVNYLILPPHQFLTQHNIKTGKMLNNMVMQFSHWCIQHHRQEAAIKVHSHFVELSFLFVSHALLFLSFSAQGFWDILYAGLAHFCIHVFGPLIQFHEPGLRE